MDDFDTWSLEELEARLLTLTEERLRVQEEARRIQAAIDRKRVHEAARATVERLGPAEREALRSVLATGIQSGASVGQPGR